MLPLRVRIACFGVAGLLAGCAGSSASRANDAPTQTPSAVASPSTMPPTATSLPKPRVTQALAAPVPFRSNVSAVTAADLGKSWHTGCPVGPAALRALTMTFWGFDHQAHSGSLIVNASAVTAVRDAFHVMYDGRFPIRRMVPIAAYGGDDNKSMASDNTSAFNCRYAVANGPKSWSMHAYGEAVDIDTLENPYTLDGRVYPPAGKPYTDRSRQRGGMIVPGSLPVRAFSSVGWGWGGRWSSSPDYQHFSANGR